MKKIITIRFDLVGGEKVENFVRCRKCAKSVLLGDDGLLARVILGVHGQPEGRVSLMDNQPKETYETKSLKRVE